jgi:hypothetical protein
MAASSPPPRLGREQLPLVRQVSEGALCAGAQTQLQGQAPVAKVLTAGGSPESAW